ncbi:hypothetical protein LCGC14_0697690 [marine sediment metagenome]|uniref:DNA 3'-5' helicase n=1 Tax=marine sediment metagenome TaxID=412755 RepID=A0A0F9T4L0_9ZZZZ
MNSKKYKNEEDFIFEFYEEDSPTPLEENVPDILEDYKKINFDKELNEQQLAIIDNLKGPMLVIAGAGSGKTRVIIYSVAKLLLSGIKPSEIMLVTFTNKAANEMIKRVETILGKRPKGIWAGTFHSIANRFIRKYAKMLGLKPNYTIMDETDAKTLMKLSIERANVKEIEERFPTSGMTKNMLSYSINCNKSIRDVILWKYNQFDNVKVIDKIVEVLKIYEKKKAEDNLVDFDDLLVYWNKLLDDRTIAQLIANRIRFVLVDEYQDTNFIQDEIIYKIVIQNPEQNIMAVGDDAQSIYAFRGANFQNILKFEKKYKKCKQYSITYNYRSVPEILELANNSIEHNKKQFKKEMKATRPAGLKPFQLNLGDDEDQAKFISNNILKLRDEGFELQEIAILYRAGHHSVKIELELQVKNIPYEVRSGVSFFEKAHIKDILMHLRLVENPYDEIAWSRIFTIVQGLGKTSASKILSIILQSKNPLETVLENGFFKIRLKGTRIPSIGKKNLISHIKNISKYKPEDNPSEVIRKIVRLLNDYIKIKYSDWEDRIEDLHQLSVYAQKYPTIRKFIDTLSLNLSNIESKTVRSGVQDEEEKPLILSTIHRAKGLEWRVVFIPMLCEDSFPSSRVKNDPESFEEERRVFYVAITRAKDQLYLISPSMIQQYGGYQITRLSPFVSELNPKVYRKSSVQFKSKINHKKDSIKNIHKSLFQTADELLSYSKSKKKKSK